MKLRSTVSSANTGRCATRIQTRRGSTYVLILGVSMMVTLIGISGMFFAKVQRHAVTSASDMTEARFNAISAIDYVLVKLKDDPVLMRSNFNINVFPTDIPIGGGTMSIIAVDLVDGDPTNNTTDPLFFRGIGTMGDAVHMVEVTVKFSGIRTEFESGSWKQVVN